MIDMIVATLTNAISTLPKGLSPLNWLDDFLYLPEVLYVLFFVWLLCSGPGKFSVDYWLAGKLLSDRFQQIGAARSDVVRVEAAPVQENKMVLIGCWTATISQCPNCFQ